jgi:hypothetical protein
MLLAGLLSGLVPANTPIPMDVFAAGTFGSNPSVFQAAADPVFAIADELVPGTNINFRDAFTVLVSPDVTRRSDRAHRRFRSRPRMLCWALGCLPSGWWADGLPAILRCDR